MVEQRNSDPVRRLLEEDRKALFRLDKSVFSRLCSGGETRESFMGRFLPKDRPRHCWFLRTCKSSSSVERSYTGNKDRKKRRKNRTRPAPGVSPSRLPTFLDRGPTWRRKSSSLAKLRHPFCQSMDLSSRTKSTTLLNEN